MSQIKTIEDQLGGIEWDFLTSSAVKGIHSIHPYPAKFIPEIPRTLLDILPLPEGTAVMDPFCGSGTTLVEAQNKGIPTVGVDLNPIACLMSKVKTTSLPGEFLEVAEYCTKNAKDKSRYEIKHIPNLDHWFETDIQNAISALIEEIDKVEVKDIQDGLRLALSSIIVRVSNQESDTRYAAIEKNVTKNNVFDYFLVACKKFSIHLNGNLFSDNVSCEVINKSILEVTPSDINKKIGMVITSPPYPNAYEYWLYHKYRMWWLGYDPNAVKVNEIGARAHYFKKNHQTIEDFIIQMDYVISLLSQVVVSSGYICFVVGRSIIHGKEYNNAQIIEDLALKHELSVVSIIERNIAKNRKSFNLSHAKIKKETLLVLQKK
ncbi:DNA methyltransferase [Metaplanococcus flavidus]|uniref:site-specific DNA-methyltransferase (cytosine-N(4)-specific) n=1 Tax=Metaplanococcus flavidus TaxID=569883 RepID=A0ABW3LCH7_9BACL